MTNNNWPFIQTAKVKHGREEESMFQRKRFFLLRWIVCSTWIILDNYSRVNYMLFYFKTHCKSSKWKIYPCLSWKILYCVVSRKSKKINICIKHCSIWIRLELIRGRQQHCGSSQKSFFCEIEAGSIIQKWTSG